MVTKRSQRRPDSSSLCDAIMDAVRSGSLPKSPIHATTEVVAVAKPGPCGIPKKPHQREAALASCRSLRRHGVRECLRERTYDAA